MTTQTTGTITMPSYETPPEQRPSPSILIGRSIKSGLCVIGFAGAGAYLIVHGHGTAGTVCIVMAILSA